VRHSQVFLVVFVLCTAAVLSINGLTRYPPGFNNAEITNINVTETVRSGKIATFYFVGNRGYEGLYPLLEAAVTGWVGDGLVCYRVLSVWCSLIALALVFALTRRLFGTYAGIVAMITLAVGLWPQILARSAIREILLLPLSAGLLWIIARAVNLRRTITPKSPQAVPYAWLGAVMMLCLYVHWIGLVAPLVGLVFLIYLLLTRQPLSRRVIGSAGFALLVAIIMGLPYLIFTLRSFRSSGLYSFWADRPENITAFAASSLQAILSIAIHGDTTATHNIPGFGMVGPVGVVLLLIGLGVAVRSWRVPSSGLLLIAVMIGLLPAAWTSSDVDFSRMILALPALAALIGLGASTLTEALLKSPVNLRAAPLPNVLLLVATVVAAGVTTLQLADWGKRPDVETAYNGQLGHLAAFLDQNQDELTTSICTLNLENLPDKISDPALLDMMMHHKATNLRFSNCLNGLVITQGGALQRFAFAQSDAAAVMSPLLKPWLQDSRSVPVEGLPDGSVLLVDATQSLADLGGQLTTQPVYWDPDRIGTTATPDLPVRMGDYLTFKGYQLFPGKQVKPGDTLNVVTFWRADRSQQADLRIFVHVLIDPRVEPVLQNDMLSVRTEYLEDRDIFIQVTPLLIPSEFADGHYALSIGAYHNRPDGQMRLPIYDVSQERGDRLFLDTVTVAR
jgi:hypothetical protein